MALWYCRGCGSVTYAVKKISLEKGFVIDYQILEPNPQVVYKVYQVGLCLSANSRSSTRW